MWIKIVSPLSLVENIKICSLKENNNTDCCHRFVRYFLTMSYYNTQNLVKQFKRIKKMWKVEKMMSLTFCFVYAWLMNTSIKKSIFSKNPNLHIMIFEWRLFVLGYRLTSYCFFLKNIFMRSTKVQKKFGLLLNLDWDKIFLRQKWATWYVST